MHQGTAHLGWISFSVNWVYRSGQHHLCWTPVSSITLIPILALGTHTLGLWSSRDLSLPQVEGLRPQDAGRGA